jgi:hypothetical protein
VIETFWPGMRPPGCRVGIVWLHSDNHGIEVYSSKIKALNPAEN